MLKPVNNHILIEPVVHETFIVTNANGTPTYQEIGVIRDLAEPLPFPLQIGQKVYFDSWLAKKYPREGREGEYLWLVDYKHVVAVDDGIEVPK